VQLQPIAVSAAVVASRSACSTRFRARIAPTVKNRAASLPERARSLLGVILDFSGIGRERVAGAWQRRLPVAEASLFAETLSNSGGR